MKNKALEQKLSDEILSHLDSRKTLQLSTLGADGNPYGSYAPFAFKDDYLLVLLSEIAIHGKNLQINPIASALIIEDEDTAAQLFARKRVNYKVAAEHIQNSHEDWQNHVDVLAERHGERIQQLSQLNDFKLFKLVPQGGRYVKGFGKAYTIEGGKLSGDSLTHLTEGHRKKEQAETSEPATATA